MRSTKSQNVNKKPMVSTKIAKTTLQYRQNSLELPKNKNTISKKNRSIAFLIQKVSILNFLS